MSLLEIIHRGVYKIQQNDETISVKQLYYIKREK